MVAELPDRGDINGDGVVSYEMIEGDPENIDAQYCTEYSIKALSVLGKSESQYLQAFRAHFFLTFPPVLCNFFHWLLHNYASLSGVLVNLVFNRPFQLWIGRFIFCLICL